MYEFGLFLLDPEERTLSCQGMPLALTPKAFDTLLYLVRNPGRTLTKEELLKQIWPNTLVRKHLYNPQGARRERAGMSIYRDTSRARLPVCCRSARGRKSGRR